MMKNHFASDGVPPSSFNATTLSMDDWLSLPDVIHVRLSATVVEVIERSQQNGKHKSFGPTRLVKPHRRSKK